MLKRNYVIFMKTKVYLINSKSMHLHAVISCSLDHTITALMLLILKELIIQQLKQYLEIREVKCLLKLGSITERSFPLSVKVLLT